MVLSEKSSFRVLIVSQRNKCRRVAFLPPTPLLPLITAWFLLPSLMSFMISSLWQQCSTTLSCSIMNGHIWSCTYLHLWAHPGKRYKKCDLPKHQKLPKDQVNHTIPIAVPLLFLFPASLVLYLRERRWQPCITFSAISSQTAVTKISGKLHQVCPVNLVTSQLLTFYSQWRAPDIFGTQCI